MRDDRPVLLNPALVARSKPEHRQIVGQRIEPDVHHVLRIVWNGDTPLEGSTADAQILKSRFDKRTNFVQSKRGLPKLRVRTIEIEQRLLVLRQAKVVALLFQPFDFVATRRALTVNQLRLGYEDFVDGAVPAFVVTLI